MPLTSPLTSPVAISESSFGTWTSTLVRSGLGVQLPVAKSENGAGRCVSNSASVERLADRDLSRHPDRDRDEQEVVDGRDRELKPREVEVHVAAAVSVANSSAIDGSIPRGRAITGHSASRMSAPLVAPSRTACNGP
jgi:hypothetical protein